MVFEISIKDINGKVYSKELFTGSLRFAQYRADYLAAGTDNDLIVYVVELTKPIYAVSGKQELTT